LEQGAANEMETQRQITQREEEAKRLRECLRKLLKLRQKKRLEAERAAFEKEYDDIVKGVQQELIRERNVRLSGQPYSKDDFQHDHDSDDEEWYLDKDLLHEYCGGLYYWDLMEEDRYQYLYNDVIDPGFDFQHDADEIIDSERFLSDPDFNSHDILGPEYNDELSAGSALPKKSDQKNDAERMHVPTDAGRVSDKRSQLDLMIDDIMGRDEHRADVSGVDNDVLSLNESNDGDNRVDVDASDARNGIDALSSSDDAVDVKDREWRENITDPTYAFVRHKRLSLDDLDEMEAKQYTDDFLEDYEHLHCNSFGYYDDGYSFSADWFYDDYDFDAKGTKVPAKPKQKKASVTPHYKSARQVKLIRRPSDLKIFCNDLRDSVERFTEMHGGNHTASAVGFDLEYCSLELDIRQTLPAMIQLSSPDPKGEVGLIWLDKFPNHGRNALRDSNYGPLLSILSDSSILKVGAGVSTDIKHLAEWWNVDEKDYDTFFFAGVTNIDDELDDRVQGKSLQEMVASVLQRHLPKVKEKNAKAKKQRRKKGKKVPTAHWRTDSITKEMKAYAANDAASSVDVWSKLKD